MNTYYILRLSALAMVLILLSSCGSGEHDSEAHTDAVNLVNPQEIFQNEYARLLHVTLEPGQQLEGHHGEDRLIYSLSDYSILWEEEGKEAETKTWEAGEVHLHEAGMHTAENNGNTTAEWLAVLRNEADLPDCSELSSVDSMHDLGTSYGRKIMEDDAYRVTEIAIDPGGRIPMHAGLNRLIYSLSDYKLSYESRDQTTLEQRFERGEAHWHTCDEHAVTNTGDSEAHYLVVSFK